MIAIGEMSGHPDWYIESLSKRYQYLVDEMAAEKAKRVLDPETIGIAVTAAFLAYLAFGNIWAGFLFLMLFLSAKRSELGRKRYQIAVQMLMIEAELPYVRETVALPKGERP